MIIEIVMSQFTTVLLTDGRVETCYDDQEVSRRLEKDGWKESGHSFRGDQYITTYTKEER